jgi:hypothetical protein
MAFLKQCHFHIAKKRQIIELDANRSTVKQNVGVVGNMKLFQLAVYVGSHFPN